MTEPPQIRRWLRGLAERVAPPSALLRTVHWMFVALGAILLLDYLLQLLVAVVGGKPGPAWQRWLTAAALVATAVVWYRGYRRRRYGDLDGIVDAAAVFLVALNLNAVAGAADLAFARALLRSMSGSLARKLLDTALGLAALAAGLFLSNLPTDRVVLRLVILGPALFAVTLMFHVFSINLARYSRALERERVLTRVNNHLNSRPDVASICRITLEATTELVDDFVRGAIALGPADRLEVLATSDHVNRPVGALLTYDGREVRRALPGRASITGSPPAANPPAGSPPPTAPSAANPSAVNLWLAPPEPEPSTAWEPSMTAPHEERGGRRRGGRSESSLIMPITVRDGFQGVLLLDTEMPVLANVRSTLESLSNSAGLALANAQLTAELTNLAFYDPLTRLSNRSLLSEQADKAVARAARGGTTVALLVLDLNDFKRINDELGHRAGDEALVIVAARLLDQVREGDVVARLGGDEFAVLLTDLRDAEEATTVARRIVGTLSWPIEVGEHPMQVGASVGVAVWSIEDGRAGGTPLPKLDPLLHDADTAMYLAKSRGTGYEVFSGPRRGPWPRPPGSGEGGPERRRRRPAQ